MLTRNRLPKPPPLFFDLEVLVEERCDGVEVLGHAQAMLGVLDEMQLGLNAGDL